MSLINKLSSLHRLCLAIFITQCFAWPSAFAASVTGRFTVGAYGATETFKDNESGSERNDFLTGSARLYLHVSELGEEKNWEITSDIRDKHDLFDRLDRERLKLTERNTLQVRQLNAVYRSPNKSSFAGLGRLAIQDAGSVFCDGGMTGYKASPNWTLVTFGGLNARRPDQQFVTTNTEGLTYGGVARYHSKNAEALTNFFGSAALVEQMYEGQLDRRYLHTTSSWNSPGSHLIHLLYLDFVPRTNVQSAFINWRKNITDGLFTNVNGLAVDVIEYSRRQGVRERLDPSPYREGSLELSKRFGPQMTSSFTMLYGKRSADQMQKHEYRWRLQMPRWISPRWDSSVGAFYRDNFISKDTMLRGGIGYFSSSWELSFSLETGVEKYDNGDIMHPVMADLSYGRYVSKSFFWALTAERAQDERVTINSVFLKFSYRFGDQEIAPIRDGAAPRGRL